MEVVQEPRSDWVAHGVLDRFATGLPERLGARVKGQWGCVRFVRSETVLFGAIELDEVSLSEDRDGADGDAPSPLERVTREAYDALFGCLKTEDFPYLARVWNFIPDIIGEHEGQERYRLFNAARQAAFNAAGRAVTGDVPAATGIGLDLAPLRLQVYFIASRLRAIPIENPRQVSAFHYPSQYGVKSPTFARAVVMPLVDGPLLLISGTASIVGHETVHHGDVIAQTHEIFANLSALIAAANDRVGKDAFSLARLAYRIYVRRAIDIEAVRRVVETHLGSGGRVDVVHNHVAQGDTVRALTGGARLHPERLYVRADICRPNLLVEIEASGGGAPARAAAS